MLCVSLERLCVVFEAVSFISTDDDDGSLYWKAFEIIPEECRFISHPHVVCCVNVVEEGNILKEDQVQVALLLIARGYGNRLGFVQKFHQKHLRNSL